MLYNKKISLVIPCYNEEAGLAQILRNDLSNIDEIIVVDNNCTDQTTQVALKRYCQVVRELRKGYGYAYKAGFEKATGEIIVTMDGDATYPTMMIDRMVSKLVKKDYDFISANRFTKARPKNMLFLNYLGNRILTIVLRFLFSNKIRDSQSGMWVFKRSILQYLHLISNGMSFSQEIKIEVIKKNYKYGEMGIAYYPRIGSAKLKMFSDGFKNLAFLFYKRFN